MKKKEEDETVKCREPIRIDDSLLEVDEKFINHKKPIKGVKVTKATATSDRGLQDKGKDLLPVAHTVSTPVMRVESISSSPPSHSLPQHSSRMLLSRLFELASDATDTDHPLCVDCTQVVLSDFQRQIVEAENEEEQYKSLLETREDALSAETQTKGELAQDIERLEAEEEELCRQLLELNDTRTLIDKETRKLAFEVKKIELIEERYWESFNEYESSVQAYEEDSKAVESRVEHCEVQLKKLYGTDVYNATFHIWYDGHFGTINGFRLGKLKSQPVNWPEINAAWGQAALLLFTVAHKLRVPFKQYRPIPMGSQSMMCRVDDNSKYELFFSSDITFGKLFWFSHFDTAMVAFLKCLKEISEFATAHGDHLDFPAKIIGDKLRAQTGDTVSIKRQFNDEENWTRALKYVLIDLKFLIAWMARSEKVS